MKVNRSGPSNNLFDIIRRKDGLVDVTFRKRFADDV